MKPGFRALPVALLDKIKLSNKVTLLLKSYAF